MGEKQFTWMDAIKLGLAGGAASLLLCLVGMVEAFHERDIIVGVISTGQTFLFLTTLIICYFAVARYGRSLNGVAVAAMTGGVIGAIVSLLVIMGQILEWDLRKILVNASPALYKILTFEGEPGTAVFLLIITGILIGALAGVIYLLPDKIRRAVLLGLAAVVTIGLFHDLIRLTINRWETVTDMVAWMFGTKTDKGLSIAGTVFVFTLVFVLNYAWSTWGNSIQKQVQALPSNQQTGLRWVSGALALALLYILPALLGPALTEATNTVGIYILMGLGLNIVVGFAGLLDLGYVAFFAIGAYVTSILTTTGGELSTSFGWTFWEALPVAVGCAILGGVILGLPVLHVRGDYLAIVTLGFGEIIRLMVLSDFLKPHIGGSQGIVQVARAQIGEFVFDRPENLYYLVIAGCLLAAFVAYRLKDSRMGRTWMALREDEDVAQAMGIDLVKTKLLAFGVGAGFSGLAGAIFASKLGGVTPASFGLLVSINALSLIIVGGMGSIPGVIVGALALVGLPELLREFSEFRLLVYGAVLMAMMLVRPEGLWPEEAHRRELAQTDTTKPQGAAQKAAVAGD